MEFSRDAWLTLLGRLHMAAVHFPLALSMLAALLDVLERRWPSEARAATVRTLLRLAAPAALAAAALGWIHADREPLGQSTEQLLRLHRWTGVACAVLACLAAVGASSAFARKFFAWPAALLVAVTGHLGGSLVYGEGYYLAAFERPSQPASVIELESAPSGASFNRDALPVLNARCTECHGEKKQKGDLRLDRFESAWFEPGEYGTVVVRGKPAESELLRRIELALDDEDHMPPKKSAQPSPQEIAVLRRWIELGAQP